MKGLFTSITVIFSLLPLLTVVSNAASDEVIGTLTYEVEYDNVKTPLRYYNDGKHLRVEMGEEGDPYLVWIRGIEGVDGVAVINPLLENYSIEFDGPPMWDKLRSDGSIDKRRKPPEVQIPEGSSVEFMGFQCVQYELDTDGPDTTILMLNDAPKFPFMVTRSWKTLFEAIPYLQKLVEKHNGIPVKVLRTNWRGKIHFSMELKSRDAEPPPASSFTIPEGYYKTASQVRGGRMGGGRGGRGPGGNGR